MRVRMKAPRKKRIITNKKHQRGRESLLYSRPQFVKHYAAVFGKPCSSLAGGSSGGRSSFSPSVASGIGGVAVGFGKAVSGICAISPLRSFSASIEYCSSPL